MNTETLLSTLTPAGIEPDPALLQQWLLTSDPVAHQALVQAAFAIKQRYSGPGVFLRGLMEISNRCQKNCLYCGIRGHNHLTVRYDLLDEEILALGRKAAQLGYASIVLQAGERQDNTFVKRITRLLCALKDIALRADVTGGSRKPDGAQGMGITLSLGEQSQEVYEEWYAAGAHRYLLRIEASDPELYAKIHPKDALHTYDRRMKALQSLRRAGYQVGTGVMIGLPFQTEEHLAKDLLFFKEMDIDMCGMGPYIPHHDTPLAQYAEGIPSERRRLELSIRMVALLRLLMPDINIAATTALQVLSATGREMAIEAGANVVMPNLTDLLHRSNYDLYDGKPGASVDADLEDTDFSRYLAKKEIPILRGEWGDSNHFFARNQRD